MEQYSDLAKLFLTALAALGGILAALMQFRSFSTGRRAALLEKFVDQGIALSETVGNYAKKEGRPLSSYDKMREALTWAKERCKELKVKTTDAELRKLIEIRLGLSRKK